MAITKIMKIDSAKVGNPSSSLKRSITYIMNPEKTEALKWTGGNAGTLPEESYNTMMITKEDFGKMTGRQGYHMVISFKPGEIDELTAYNIAQEFGEEYFGDRYDYCFAVHNDHEHMHIHFIFNSIDRISGYKYRYENGDWAKTIQPITDRLCIKHGLKALHFDKENIKGNVSYGEWREKRENAVRKNYSELIRQDFDEAIKMSGDFDEFISCLKEKYQIRFGYSRKWQSEYFTIFSEEMGMERPRRNYALGSAYTVNNIKDLIKYKTIPDRFPVNTVMIGITNMIRIKMQREEPVYTKKQRRMLHYHWRLRKIQRGGISARILNKELKESRELLSDLDYQFSIQCVDPFSAEDIRIKRRLQLKNIRKQIQETEQYLELPDPEEKEYLEYRLQDLQSEVSQIKAELYRLNHLIETVRSEKEKKDDEVQHRTDKPVR